MKPLYKVFAVLLFFPTILFLIASSSGSPGGRSGSPGDNNQTCTACHTGTAVEQSGWISSNIPAAGYTPGATYQITLNGTHSGVSKFGFELTAENSSGQKVGTFSITEAGRTKLTNQNKAVTHTSGGTAPSGGTVSWTMNWTAPASDIGQVRFYAALNAANGNGNTSGDVIYRTSLFVNAAAPAALASVDPSQASQGSNPTLTITGTNTSWTGTTPNVRLRKSGTSNFINAITTIVNSNSQLQAQFTFAPDASPGSYDVMVDDLTLLSSFTIIELIPSLVAIVPNTAAQGELVTVEISAENTFWVGSSPSVSLTHLSAVNIEATNVTVNSNNSLTATFAIPVSATTGIYDVNVNNLVLAEAFTITLLSGVENQLAKNTNVYPNPATDHIFVDAAVGSVIKLLDLSGKTLLESNVETLRSRIAINNLSKGLYLIEITQSGQKQIEKVIKK